MQIPQQPLMVLAPGAGFLKVYDVGIAQQAAQPKQTYPTKCTFFGTSSAYT